MKKRLCFIFLSMLLLSPATYALESYVGVDYGKSLFAQFLYEDDDTSFRIYGGIRSNENLGFELFYTDLGEYKDSLIGSTTFAIDGAGVSLLYNFPMTDRFETFAKIGVMAWNKDVISGPTSGADDGTDLLIGVGIDYDINQTLSLRAGYDMYYLEDILDMVTIGIKVNF